MPGNLMSWYSSIFNFTGVKTIRIFAGMPGKWTNSISGSLLLLLSWTCLQAQDTAIGTAPVYPLGMQPTPRESYDTKWRYADGELTPFDDTLALDFHLYNPAFLQDLPHIYLGNLGQAMRPIVFDYEAVLGYYPGFDAFDNYWFSEDDLKYYRTRTPFTSLGYAFGQGNENLIKITHSQNINSRINLAVDYLRPVSQGQSQRQKAATHNMAATGWFQTKGWRYEALAGFIFNQTKNEENGGWSDPEALENDIYKNKRELVPIFLSNALNTWSQRNVRLQQHFYLGGKTDSTNTNDKSKGFLHIMEYDNRRFKYTDDGDVSAFYTNAFIDSTRTDDRTSHWMLSNTFAWEQQLPRLRYRAGVLYGGGKYFSQLNHQSLYDARIFAEVTGYTGSDSSAISYEADIEADYLGDLIIRGLVSLPVKDKWALEAALSAAMISSTDRDDFYFSNHFAWDNDFKKTTSIQASAVVKFLPWDLALTAESHTLSRYIYFNTINQPEQIDHTMQVVVGGAQLEKKWRHIGWKGYAWLQWSSDDAVQLPFFVTRQSIFYKGGFIKGLVKANLGFDVWYHTPYFADAWNPATATFHRQDAEKSKTYPTLDVFFDIQIKRARLFFVMQHVNQGLFKPNGYYLAPGYAAQDRAFKMGVSWQFYD
jgi:hypothetical protein